MKTTQPVIYKVNSFHKPSLPWYDPINLLLVYFSTNCNKNFFVRFSLKGLYEHFNKLYKVGWSRDGIHHFSHLTYKKIIHTLQILDNHDDIQFLQIRRA